MNQINGNGDNTKEKMNGILTRLWWGLTLITGLGLIILISPHLVSGYYIEAAASKLGQAAEANSNARQHLLEASLADLTRAISWQPDNSFAYWKKGQALAALERYDQALLMLHTAEKSNNNPLLKLEIGDIYHAQGDVDQAIRYYEAGSVGTRKPQLLADYYELIQQHLAAGQIEPAETLLRDKVLPLDAGNICALYKLARLAGFDSEIGQQYTAQALSRPVSFYYVPEIDNCLPEAIGGLIEAGVWPEAYGLAVVRGLAQRYHHDSGLIALIEQISQQVDRPANWYDLLGEIHLEKGDYVQAKRAYLQSISLNQANEKTYLHLGQAVEQLAAATKNPDLLPEALAAYRHAQALSADNLAASWLIVRLYAKLGLLDRAQSARREVEQQAATLKPIYLMPPNQTAIPGLLGYSYDQTAADFRLTFDLWLFWQKDVVMERQATGPTWFETENYFIQIIEVKNLAPNSGFAWDFAQGKISAYGYPGYLYEEGFSHRHLGVAWQNDWPNHYAVLENDEKLGKNSMVSESFPVTGGAYYLQAGFVSNTEGRAYLGRAWLGESDDPIDYGYVIGDIIEPTWQYYAQVRQAPEAAKAASIWLINLGHNSRAQFDNMIFVEIPYPPIGRP